MSYGHFVWAPASVSVFFSSQLMMQVSRQRFITTLWSTRLTCALWLSTAWCSRTPSHLSAAAHPAAPPSSPACHRWDTHTCKCHSLKRGELLRCVSLVVSSIRMAFMDFIKESITLILLMKYKVCRCFSNKPTYTQVDNKMSIKKSFLFFTFWTHWLFLHRYNWKEARWPWICLPLWLCLHRGKQLCPPGGEEHHSH